MYGLTTFAVEQRRHEIGLRMALGAQPAQIVAEFFHSLRWPLIVGLLLGLPMATLTVQLLQRANLVTGKDQGNPGVYGGAALLLFACAFVATFLPAIRATHAEPWQSLRGE